MGVTSCNFIGDRTLTSHFNGGIRISGGRIRRWHRCWLDDWISGISWVSRHRFFDHSRLQSCGAAVAYVPATHPVAAGLPPGAATRRIGVQIPAANCKYGSLTTDCSFNSVKI